ncbi:HNH endonuclease (plasmid) [Deinococcus psychrotolerans]|uniref:HNH endonuclease n=1 Tax=Deinococcus psychrotolerans TaxID=2489213 RepID=A0A3G8YJW5_9DEIO|nr:HNH endonuclease signature motif containing protein [Deinococcus psychrotolerans]AZI45180.1 HNH endonuclease [Deinococcus psychrotolerans]AZI45185.1 HNH endonuclease [Deinococcus psychrotolerans]
MRSEIRAAVRHRDPRCLCCQREDSGLQIDHIQPFYLGGMHDIENLQLLCGDCNRTKETVVMTGPQGLELAPSRCFSVLSPGTCQIQTI